VLDLPWKEEAAMQDVMERPSKTDMSPEPEALLDSLDLPPGQKAELIEGDIVVSPAPTAVHQQLLMRISRPMVIADWDPHWDVGVAISPDRYFIPDLTVVPCGFEFSNPEGSWQSPLGIEMVVEVTSSNPDKDRNAKRRGYAAVGIPLYLLIDRDRKETVLFSEPRDGEYAVTARRPFGEPIPLPEPFSFALEDIR
jgi:Uma2 family endonuclease